MTSAPGGAGRRLAVRAAALLAIAACGTPQPGGPSTADCAPAPASSAEAADWSTFASSRYGFILEYPASWVAAEVAGAMGIHPFEPGLDTFQGPNAKQTMAVGIEVLEAGTALDHWTSRIVAHVTGPPPDDHALVADSTGLLTIGCEPGRVMTYHVDFEQDTYFVIEGEAIHDGVGYTVHWLSTAKSDEIDRDIYDHMAGSMRFTGPPSQAAVAAHRPSPAPSP